MNDRKLRDILENKPPELKGEAALRIEARVRERMEAGPRRPGRSWALAIAPAMLVILALLWLLPRGGSTPEFLMVNEDQFLEYLSQMDNTGGDLSEVLELEYELDSDDWSSEQRETFMNELEIFSLDTI